MLHGRGSQSRPGSSGSVNKAPLKPLRILSALKNKVSDPKWNLAYRRYLGAAETWGLSSLDSDGEVSEPRALCGRPRQNAYHSHIQKLSRSIWKFPFVVY